MTAFEKFLLFLGVLVVVLITAGVALSASTPNQVGDGGTSLPPCNSAWWGSTTVYQGRVWVCPKYSTHWVLR